MFTRSTLPLLLGTVFLLTTSAVSEEKAWREVRSPHFRVITDGSEGAGRRVAREFEQMRGLFADRFPGFRVDSPAPLLILAPEDESSTKKLLPEFWQHSGPKPAGMYFHAWEKEGDGVMKIPCRASARTASTRDQEFKKQDARCC